MARTQLDTTVQGEILAEFIDRGVIVVDPRQTFIGPEIVPERVCEGAILHPGTRLLGARTFVASGAQVGCHGPATLVDTVLGPDASVEAGYLEGAVLLDRARAGWGAHFRPGTILEEEASSAHAVGLKQTILLSFVTAGSLINFCDALVAGGSSRRDHSEIGSGFIHFNFTPWGKHGDKATPSLIGDAVRGVFLRERRVFLGGTSGLVGPGQVGYGAITGAGQVLRNPVPEGALVVQESPTLQLERSAGHLDDVEPRAGLNVQYIAQLVALRCWYRQVRSARLSSASPLSTRVAVEAAIENLDLCLAERVKRLTAFLEERGATATTLELEATRPCPLPVEATEPYIEHVTWVQSLSDQEVAAGQRWMQSVVDAVVAG